MDLDLFRKNIEEIDLNILHLLNKRMINSLMISRLKGKIKDEEREKYIFDYVGKYTSMLLGQEFKIDIFKKIIEESCLIQQKGKGILVVAEQDDFSVYTKNLKQINKTITFFTCKNIELIFELLEKSFVDYSVISKVHMEKIKCFSSIKIIEEFDFTHRFNLSEGGGSSKIDLLLIGKGE